MISTAFALCLISALAARVETIDSVGVAYVIEAPKYVDNPRNLRRCPVCGDRPHDVFGMTGLQTLIAGHAYEDELGRAHWHDSNTTTYQRSCSNGHQWTYTAPAPPCPVDGCGWGKEQEE